MGVVGLGRGLPPLALIAPPLADTTSSFLGASTSSPLSASPLSTGEVGAASGGASSASEATAAARAAMDAYNSRGEAPHGHFTRKGDDLCVAMTCTLSQALCGFTVSLKSLDGRDIRVPVEGVLRPGDTVTVGGEGMPIKGGPAKGNLLITFDVRFPTQELTEAQKTAVKGALKGLQ